MLVVVTVSTDRFAHLRLLLVLLVVCVLMDARFRLCFGSGVSEYRQMRACALWRLLWVLRLAEKRQPFGVFLLTMFRRFCWG